MTTTPNEVTDRVREPLDIVVRCDCLSLNHAVALSVFFANRHDPSPSAFLQVTTPTYLRFWGRVRAALAYVFGGEGPGFDTVCLTKHDAQRLRDGLDAFIAEPGVSWPHGKAGAP